MTLTVNIQVTVGSITFDYVESLKVEKSWTKLTDTATITMPRSIGRDRFDELVTVGSPVTIACGYNGVYHRDFTGYITRIYPGYPVKIECEDEMWQLKKGSISQRWDSVNLQEVVRTIAPNYERDVLSTNLGPFLIDKATPAKVLSYINDKYGLVSYFRDKVLVVGNKYPDQGATHRYHFQHNVVSTSNLQWVREEDRRVQVTAISTQPDGNKVKVTFGDDDGDTRTLNFYNLSLADLKNRATELLAEVKQTGYDGNFTAFGYPFAEHGDIASLEDQYFTERTGSYFIDAVKVRFNAQGLRRIITLGKASTP